MPMDCVTRGVQTGSGVSPLMSIPLIDRDRSAIDTSNNYRWSETSQNLMSIDRCSIVHRPWCNAPVGRRGRILRRRLSSLRPSSLQ